MVFAVGCYNLLGYKGLLIAMIFVISGWGAGILVVLLGERTKHLNNLNLSKGGENGKKS